MHDSATLPILLKELGLLTILETWENFLDVNSGRKMIQIFNMQRLKIDTVS